MVPTVGSWQRWHGVLYEVVGQCRVACPAAQRIQHRLDRGHDSASQQVVPPAQSAVQHGVGAGSGPCGGPGGRWVARSLQLRCGAPDGRKEGVALDVRRESATLQHAEGAHALHLRRVEPR
eukprot:scaffold58492_cov59-Phaeocystis_antarctica.AAC.4